MDTLSMTIIWLNGTYYIQMFKQDKIAQLYALSTLKLQMNYLLLLLVQELMIMDGVLKKF